MSTSSFQAALARLHTLTNYETVKSVPYRCYGENLDRLAAFLRFLGYPQRKLKTVHVAGTKGKGSVCFMLEAILRAGGYRTGLFTSPHLFSVLERFLLDGKECPESLFTETVFELFDQWDSFAAELPGNPLTFFEWSVIIAISIFLKSKTDIIILETGMGGRIDATNLCEPLVAVLTGISYDHRDQLGNTLLEIAGEKCGIIKEKVPVVSGIGAELLFVCYRTDPLAAPSVTADDVTELRRFISDRAREKNAPLTQIVEISKELKELSFRLPGEHQKWNAQLVCAVLEILAKNGLPVEREIICRTLASVQIPGRMEIISDSPLIIVDGAHNRASAAALVKTLSENWPHHRKTVIFGVSAGKDIEGMYLEFLPCFEQYIFTSASNTPRAVPAEELLARWTAFCRRQGVSSPKSFCFENDRDLTAFLREREDISTRDLFCVTGSFYLAAEMARNLRKTF